MKNITIYDTEATRIQSICNALRITPADLIESTIDVIENNVADQDDDQEVRYLDEMAFEEIVEFAKGNHYFYEYLQDMARKTAEGYVEEYMYQFPGSWYFNAWGYVEIDKGFDIDEMEGWFDEVERTFEVFYKMMKEGFNPKAEISLIKSLDEAGESSYDARYDLASKIEQRMNKELVGWDVSSMVDCFTCSIVDETDWWIRENHIYHNGEMVA